MIRSNGSESARTERMLAIGDRVDLEALEAKVQLDQLADVRFVFDDENS